MLILAASDTQPLWVSVSSFVLNIAQALAIIVGGSWVYFKFLRSRTFARRAALDVQAAIFEIRDGRMIKIKVSLQNTGLSRLPLKRNGMAATLSGARSDEWTDGINIDWHKLMMTRIFTSHGYVEAQETIHDEILIPGGGVPTPWMAYQISVDVIADKGWFQTYLPGWNTKTVILASESAGKQAAVAKQEDGKYVG